jgi:hypothetical protein
MVEVDESLLQLTLVGCWLFDAHAAVANANELGAGKFTAVEFSFFHDDVKQGVHSGCGCDAGVASQED